jgi:hypothetical protein
VGSIQEVPRLPDIASTIPIIATSRQQLLSVLFVVLFEVL